MDDDEDGVGFMVVSMCAMELAVIDATTRRVSPSGRAGLSIVSDTGGVGR